MWHIMCDTSTVGSPRFASNQKQAYTLAVKCEKIRKKELGIISKICNCAKTHTDYYVYYVYLRREQYGFSNCM